MIEVALPHNALIYDACRNVYYASIPGSEPSGNSIAKIDPMTGGVTYSSPIGAEPNALAIAANGTALYVGLDGTGDVVKLALPSMSEQGRARLVNDSFHGQTRARTIAVSPVDSTVVAVAMAYSGVSPDHAGVALLRNMAMQPKRTQTHTGSDFFAFDSSGTTIYGTSGFDLRRIRVLPDGLAEDLVVATQFGTQAVAFAHGRVTAGNALFQAPDLTTLGKVSTPSDCQPSRSGNVLRCFTPGDFNLGLGPRLLIADAGTFVIRASLLYAAPELSLQLRLVEGPNGQVAISYPARVGFTSQIRLFASAQLTAPQAPPPPSWPVTASTTPDGDALDIKIPHNSVVYDSGRNVYYASIPGSVIGAGNSIATIDPATGQVTHSAPIGSEPNALVLAADGNALYVGLDGSGELARLALPSMTPTGRTRLVVHPFFGQTHAQTIAASPVDATVVAAALAYTGVSPPHAGVALLLDLEVQPRRTQEHTGSNYIVFDSAGAMLYGTDGSDMRRIQVLSDGLAEDLVIGSALNSRGFPLTPALANGRIIAERTLFDAPDLTVAGEVSSPSECQPQRSRNLLLCFDTLPGNSGPARLLLADPDTFVIQGSLLYADNETGVRGRLVEGPTGQVAISYPAGPSQYFPKIRLFTSAGLVNHPTPPPPSWPVTVSTTPDGQALDIGIVHNSLVYDSGRNVFYASVRGSVIGAGNSIATIDPATGQVTHSAPIGSEPNALAIAADGSVLYVGLDGSSEVARLALPSMTPQGRARLDMDWFFGRTRAESIAVSPADPGVAAVSMAYSGVSPRHAGVALLRDMSIQPKRTQTHTGSNLVAFNSAGDKVYGLNIENEAGLRRIGVFADGLVQELVVTAPVTFGQRALSFGDSRVIAGDAVFDAPALTAAGTISGATDCWAARTGSALLCFSAQVGERRVLVADSTTLAVGASLVYAPFEADTPRRLVQGPAGQVAISYVPVFATPSIRLFSSAQLP